MAVLEFRCPCKSSEMGKTHKCTNEMTLTSICGLVFSNWPSAALSTPVIYCNIIHLSEWYDGLQIEVSLMSESLQIAWRLLSLTSQSLRCHWCPPPNCSRSHQFGLRLKSCKWLENCLRSGNSPWSRGSVRRLEVLFASYPSFFPTISRPEGSSGFAPASGENRGHRCCSKSPVAIISHHLLDASGIVLCMQSHSSFSAAAGGAALPADRGTEAWLRVLCGRMENKWPRQATTVATQTEPQSNAWWQRMDLILASPPKGTSNNFDGLHGTAKSWGVINRRQAWQASSTLDWAWPVWVQEEFCTLGDLDIH